MNKQRHAPAGASLADRLRFHSVETAGGCRVWTARVNEQGYGITNIRGRPYRAHRAAWECAHGPIPEGMVVRHKCDIPGCVNVDHLEIGTQLDNVADRDARGRHKPLSGEANGFAKLTEEQVLEIRRSTGALRITAEKYNVHLSLVWLIRKNKIWRHL